MFRAALARAERVGAGPVLRAWVGLLLLASRWFQIASLYRANAKLRPTWEPRFLCFDSARDLGPSRWPRCGPRASCASRGSGPVGARTCRRPSHRSTAGLR